MPDPAVAGKRRNILEDLLQENRDKMADFLGASTGRFRCRQRGTTRRLGCDRPGRVDFGAYNPSMQGARFRTLAFLTASLTLMLLSGACRPNARPTSGDTQTARTWAEAWLKKVDAGQYEASWEDAAKLFKERVDQSTWVGQMKGIRRPLGAVKSRTLKKATYTSTLPGAPDGKYVVIVYSTEFERKARANETVTPMVDPDGMWRVSGYYIR